jgi:hypothetical protein
LDYDEQFNPKFIVQDSTNLLVSAARARLALALPVDQYILQFGFRLRFDTQPNFDTKPNNESKSSAVSFIIANTDFFARQ